MSNAALRWAFHLQMRDPSAKAVLVALADHADERGICWPSVARLCRFTSLAERTVRAALHRLVDAGAISLGERPGQTCIVTLLTPAADAPPPRQEPHPSPAAGAPTPAAAAPESSRTPTETPGEHHASPIEPRGTRLAADWRPAPAERGYAIERGLDPDLLAEEFRNYWCAVPGARREVLARSADGVAAAAERVLRRRGLGVA